jgi:hypothetical protein
MLSIVPTSAKYMLPVLSILRYRRVKQFFKAQFSTATGIDLAYSWGGHIYTSKDKGMKM